MSFYRYYCIVVELQLSLYCLFEIAYIYYKQDDRIYMYVRKSLNVSLVSRSDILYVLLSKNKRNRSPSYLFPLLETRYTPTTISMIPTNTVI